jgi:general nucleoside transport system permease protein
MKRLVLIMRSPVLGIAFAFAIAIVLLTFLGESPLVLWESVYYTAFTHFGLGYTLYYATPLILTALSVAICAHCGLFNIGAEGQLYFGALGVIVFSSLCPNLPFWLAIPGAVLASAIFGGFWAGFAGALKALRGTHEVITTILLNFVAIYFVDYCIQYRYKNYDVQQSETIAVPEAFHLTPLSDLTAKLGLEWFATTPVNTAFFFSIFLAFAVWALLFFTAWGYEFRAAGFNPSASRFSGISLKKNTMAVFLIAGSLSGMVAVNEVLGHQHKLVQGFSPEYGFTGIAVSLLARNHPIGIIFSALLFGALQNQSRELEFASEKISKELVVVLQAILIAFVASRELVERLVFKREKTRA